MRSLKVRMQMLAHEALIGHQSDTIALEKLTLEEKSHLSDSVQEVLEQVANDVKTEIVEYIERRTKEDYETACTFTRTHVGHEEYYSWKIAQEIKKQDFIP